MMRYLVLLVLFCLQPLHAYAQVDEASRMLQLANADRGRLVFAPCRTCHYPQAAMGHNNGPNLNGIFGMVAGKQAGFDYYSETFSQARFVWTPQLMYTWLENPLKMFPESRMMSRGVPDPQQRADLIAYLLQVTASD